MSGRHREVTGSAPRRFPAGTLGVFGALGVIGVLAAGTALTVLTGVGGWTLLGSGVGCDRVPLNLGACSDSAGDVDAVVKGPNASKLDTATRMLVLVDVSGSMTAAVPGVDRNRIEVTATAVQESLALVKDTSELGLWTFSTLLGGNQDHRELIPLGPLAQPVGDVSRRGALANTLITLQAKPGGGTGLYDSILAAYRTVKAGYQANKVNSVFVFTDGRNEDPTGGLSLDGLLAELKKNANPRRPVPVFIVALGPDTDIVSARRISGLTTGTAYQTNTPSELSKVFLATLGRRR